jgi:hypothetical protein
MANNLGAVAQGYTNRLDEIVSKETCTADLNMGAELLGDFAGKGQLQIAKMTLDGLADHTRGAGFVRGGAQLEWETVKLEFERDREFVIDSMDDDERMLTITGNIMAEFARGQVVPEVDAVRFARLATKAAEKTAETFTDAAAATAAVDLVEEALQDAGKDLGGCVLYTTAAFYNLLKRDQQWRVAPGTDPQRNFVTFDDMKVVIVPKTRFYTAIDLLDGTTSGEEKGGFKAAADGKALNFMVVHPDAAAAITKHETLRYFAPEVNQSDDAHLWQYRLYHDLFVYENKTGLVYANYAE